jgi:exodeoxyribonuclease V alpha subunit
MMSALLQAMPAGGRLILLGDKDQLASVEAGSVLGDLCVHAGAARYSEQTCSFIQATCGEQLTASSGADSALDQQMVMLRQSHRFGSTIGALAQAVNAGWVQGAHSATGDGARLGAYGLLARGTQEVREAQALEHRQQQGLEQDQEQPTGDKKAVPQQGGKVYLATAPVSPTVLTQLALHGRPLARACYADYLREVQTGPVPAVAAEHGMDAQEAHAKWVRSVLRAFDQFRILCAVHEGEWGDRAINQQVQGALATQGLLKPEGEWFQGRPIMVTRNDKALGVFNGDVGVVLPSVGNEKVLRAYFLDGDQLRSVSVSRLANVETAFAMTIHKSQGSEFAHTVVALPDGASDILTRELVYTGITRAKENLTLVEPRAGLLGDAIARQIKRASGLVFSAVVQK